VKAQPPVIANREAVKQSREKQRWIASWLAMTETCASSPATAQPEAIRDTSFETKPNLGVSTQNAEGVTLFTVIS
jgi:hypothetical protein